MNIPDRIISRVLQGLYCWAVRGLASALESWVFREGKHGYLQLLRFHTGPWAQEMFGAYPGSQVETMTDKEKVSKGNVKSPTKYNYYSGKEGFANCFLENYKPYTASGMLIIPYSYPVLSFPWAEGCHNYSSLCTGICFGTSADTKILRYSSPLCKMV